jgi:DNA primase large subunit
LQKLIPLRSNTSSSEGANDNSLKLERQKDHYSHFILRLAFSATEELRRRFERVESTLFRIRFQNDDSRERQTFVESLALDWVVCSEEDKRASSADLVNATPGLKKQEVEEGSWFKVDFEMVPELVESRRVYLRAGKAYVPAREQLSMVLAGFNANLARGLEVSDA